MEQLRRPSLREGFSVLRDLPRDKSLRYTYGMPLAFGVAEGGKLMDVCLRGEEPTRLRLRGATMFLKGAVANRDASTALSVTLLLWGIDFQ